LNNFRLDHAHHNYNTCEYLLNDGNHNDWVITVAFYSAHHYFRYKNFPLEFKNEDDTFVTFDKFCSFYGIEGKHGQLSELIREYVDNNIYLMFREIKNECWNCRYTNYKVSNDRAKNAFEVITKIKAYCESKKNNIRTSDRDSIPMY